MVHGRHAFWAVLALLLAGVARAATTTNAIPDEVTHLRDPFKKPQIAIGNVIPRSDLETFALDKLKLIAVVTGPQRLRAMIEAPNSKTYLVSENMRIGLRKGVIRRITPDAIHVRERVVNVLGQEENVDSEIRMADLTEAMKLGAVGTASVELPPAEGASAPSSAPTAVPTTAPATGRRSRPAVQSEPAIDPNANAGIGASPVIQLNGQAPAKPAGGG